MSEIIFHKENLKEAMKIALDKGANIEVIPQLMEEMYPLGQARLCYSEKANFVIDSRGINLDTEHHPTPLPPIAFYKDGSEVYISIIAESLMENKSLRKKFIILFTKTLKELKDE